MDFIEGYEREKGKPGIRNHVIVLPASVCASNVAVKISEKVPGSIALPHQHGCCQIGIDHEQTLQTLIGMARHPNVGGVLVVTLGCEGIQSKQLEDEAKAYGKLVRSVNIQNNGGTTRTIDLGAQLLEDMMLKVSDQKRVKIPFSKIIVGIECGGSDNTSGLISNPVVGKVVDQIVEYGGTAILSETTEMIGAEHILAKRAIDEKTAEKLLDIVERTEDQAAQYGVDMRGSQPTPGNIEGGLSTIEEKSLGCLYKAGSTPILDVLEYGQRPVKNGLNVMDTPGQDIESITGMLSGGAHAILFTTGRGTPTGSPIAPVIKITGNSKTYETMSENIDLNVGPGIDASVPIEDLSNELFSQLVKVCNGSLTKAEIHGHHEFAICRIAKTF